MLKFLNKFKKKTTEELLKEKEKYYHKNIMPQIKEIISNEDVVKMLGADCFKKKPVTIPNTLTRDELIECYSKVNKIQCQYYAVVCAIENEIEKFINSNQGIQDAYDKFYKSKKCDCENFYYNNDMFLVQIFQEDFVAMDFLDSKKHIIEETADMSNNEIAERILVSFDFIDQLHELLASHMGLATITFLKINNASRRLAKLKDNR